MSRYPAMRTYDRSLLATAPAITRQDRQAGYDVNALEQGEYYVANATRAPAASQPVAADPFADRQGYSPAASPEPRQQEQEPSKPWYKTSKGRLWIGLGIIVFIGLIAGIAAGAAAARQSKNTTLLSDNNQGQDTASTSPAPADSSFSLGDSDPSDSPLPTSTGQEPATLTFGNGVTPTTSSSRGSNQGSNNQGTTIVFGGVSSSAQVQPTSGIGSGEGDGSGSDIPPGCFIVPMAPECYPYFYGPQKN